MNTTTLIALCTLLLTAAVAEAQYPSPYLQPRYPTLPSDGGFSGGTGPGLPNPYVPGYNGNVPRSPDPSGGFGYGAPPVAPPLYGQPHMPPLYVPPPRRW